MTKGWLRDLEERVRQASDRLGELKTENGELKTENGELKTENEELRQKVGELEERLSAAPDPEETAAWNAERDEIRERVEGLVQHLDDLLSD